MAASGHCPRCAVVWCLVALSGLAACARDYDALFAGSGGTPVGGAGVGGAGLGGAAATGGSSGGCGGSTVDCDGEPGCEVDLATDPKHCGRCDAPCPECSGCSAGQCGAMRLAEGLLPVALTVDTGAVYWIGYNGAVGRVGLDGTGQAQLSNLEGALGGGIALRDADVYFTHRGDGGPNGEILRVPSRGGLVEKVLEDLHKPADLQSYPDALYLSLDPPGRVARLVPGGQLEELATGQIVPASIVRDDTRVYWVEVYGDTISWIDVGGGAVTSVASPGVEPNSLAIDASHLYWAVRGASVGRPPAFHDSAVGRLPLSAIDAGVAPGDFELLVEGQQSISSLAIDDDAVYWTTEGDGGVWRAPKAGGAATLVAAEQDLPRAVAVDALCVYWANNVLGGSIMKAPKGP